VIGSEAAQLGLEGIDPGGEVVDEGQALDEVRLPGFRQRE